MKLRKRKSTEIEIGGQDSFLDLVSNIVGILIILVMVAGIRAQYSSANVPDPAEALADAQMLAEIETKYQELQTKTAAAVALRQNVEDLKAQSEIVADQIYRQSSEYAALFDLMTSARAEIESVAEEKSNTFKEKIEYQRQLLETNAKLEQIDKAKTYLNQVRPQATVMENIPTPLSRTVDDLEKEIHIRLLGGRIVYVPFMELITQMKRHVYEDRNHYAKQKSSIGKVGPIENFELEFLLATYTTPLMYGSDSQSGTLILQYAEIVPKFEPMGEPTREALASSQSEFRRKLTLFRKDIYTVTVWVYPDSFEEYQELKRFLHDHGYSVAARPLATGHPISASP
jgi:hypothetical protein